MGLPSKDQGLFEEFLLKNACRAPFTDGRIVANQVGVQFLLIAIGCALGGAVRYLGMTAVARLCGEAFPWGTLVVNAVGSFLLGLVLGAGILAGGDWLSFEGVDAFAAIGFCGGLTTFSTFSLQNMTLVSKQQWQRALGNMVGSVLLCLMCVVAGYAISKGLTA
jgi:fluoride exporter